MFKNFLWATKVQKLRPNSGSYTVSTPEKKEKGKFCKSRSLDDLSDVSVRPEPVHNQGGGAEPEYPPPSSSDKAKLDSIDEVWGLHLKVVSLDNSSHLQEPREFVTFRLTVEVREGHGLAIRDASGERRGVNVNLTFNIQGAVIPTR